MFVGNEMYPILYTGEKGRKKVYEAEFKGKSLIAVPFCGLDNDSEFAQMGVGLLLFNPKTEENMGSFFWGMLKPRDLVASYRGMKILELLTEIRFDTLCEAWHTGARTVRSIDQEMVNKITAQIGQDTHTALLREPLPNFQEALMVLTNHGIKVATYAFEDEIRAGTMELTPFMEELGTEHPSVIDAQREHAQRLVQPFLPHVQQYLQANDHRMQGFLSENIEHYVLEGLLRGLADTDLVIGNAIVAGHYKTSLLAMSLMGFSRDMNKFMEEQMEKTIREAAEYLARTYGVDESLLKRGLKEVNRLIKKKASSSRQNRRTAKEYIRLLTDIRDRWNDMPQVVEL